MQVFYYTVRKKKKKSYSTPRTKHQSGQLIVLTETRHRTLGMCAGLGIPCTTFSFRTQGVLICLALMALIYYSQATAKGLSDRMCVAAKLQ